ncbi:LacI family DNA-binding transcriptional regulator [Oryzibacter oryziterrae]|uniref:LacI family DNA-binding transcriptional regulator n=1 Tax=Oryzibacter oryziterrae TaxID=2766474 RepID=UPI001F24B3F6|nr:LacI family DNA-binding transcriptional regulator [Oryzibacter oryziterrae]
MIGIKRLADELGLSIGTVSRALNNRPDVNDATRQRVKEAALRLGYVPNQSGRSLRAGQTGVVAFVMQTGHEITGHGDTFIMGVFSGIQTALAKHRLDLVALLCPSDEDAEDYLKRMVSRGFADGFILSSTQHVDRRIDFLAERGVPFVTLGRSSSDAGQPWIDTDFAGIAEVSIARLASKGHRRIAITVPNDETNLGFVFTEAARSALHAQGLALDPELIFGFVPNEASGYDIASRLLALPDRPTAIILLNPGLTIGLYRRLIEAGVEPGKDIAVIGRDSPQSPFLSPRLTYFREDLDSLGIALGQALLASMPRFAKSYPSGVVRQVWPSELIEGESDGLVIR